MDYSIKGRHFAADLFDVDSDVLNNGQYLFDLLCEAAEMCGATVIKENSGFKQFDPQGATVLVMLMESHISAHSYPEKNFIALDAYTCGSPDPKIAIDHIINELKSTDYEVKFITRGR